MRFTGSLLFVLFASTAGAASPPGPPPWSCEVWAACNARDTCVFLNVLPIRFKLTRIEGDTQKYRLDGADGFEGKALELPTLGDARQFAETFISDEPAPFTLVRNNRISDSHSFWLQVIAQRGNGQRKIREEKMLVGCNSIRNKLVQNLY
jgi:hypothetical protein